ncbi:oligosaccharide flippase family protein [Proteus mirabilis]|uniref:oligosaccharide flippase family protein n=1 Tax=Proteus mirabilis TaxID=584 RepID=UPI00128EDC12|nr:oligosaccharide flippase family protein [Proteus mirabilis]MCB6148654.1 oligosaccharide flippase family protein [Proteus mirabilis]MCT0102298.1 oligosaccharide flippase family protein [Proteus mirabilis]QFV07259.1 oligosaccharide flippase family protein [Proteus mirabilis]QXL75896.1 Putative O-antigen transporter [Proteus mirabilis]HEO9727990.1 oligosaccharide flippase family protein [Proteus mirabilis]
MNKIHINIISLTILQFVSYLSPLIVLPYLSRILTIVEFGFIMISFSLISLSMIITDYGFGIFSPFWIAKNRNNIKRTSLHIGSVFYIKTILVLICSILLFLYINLANSIPVQNKTYYYFLLLTSILVQTFQPTWFFQGIEKMFNITIIMSISKLSYVILIYAFIKENNNVNDIILCFLISNIIASFIGILFIYKNGYKILFPSSKSTYKLFKSSSRFFISRIAVSIYTTASTVIVGTYAGLQQSAFYSSAEKLYQAGQSLSSPISQALFPYLSRTGDKKTLYKFISFLLVPIVTIAIIASFFTNEIMTIFYGQNLSNADNILNIFIICSVINFLGVNFGYPAFSTINRLDIPNKTVILGSGIQLISLIYLYYNENITAFSVAISVLITESIVMTLRLIIYFRLLKNENYKKS